MNERHNLPARKGWRFTLRDLISLMVLFGLVLGCTVEWNNTTRHLPRSSFSRPGRIDNHFADTLVDLNVEYESGSGSSSTSAPARKIEREGEHGFSLIGEPYDSRIMQHYRERTIARVRDSNYQIDFVNQPKPGKLDDELVLTYSSDELRGFFSAKVILSPQDPEEPDEHHIRVIFRHLETPK